jgi:hypothetical protein
MKGAPKDAIMRPFLRIGPILAALLLISGCSGKAFVDGRREAGKRINVGPSNADVVAVCHGGGEPPPDAVKLAESECAKTGRSAQLAQSVRFACSLRAPTRSFFRCTGTRTGG